MNQFMALVDKSLRPVRSRLSQLVQRGIVKQVNDSNTTQTVQMAFGAEDVQDDVIRAQNYGFTSVPPTQSEAVILSPHGERDFSIALAVDSPKDRLKGLKPGDVAVYHKSGSCIVLSDGGKIQIKSGGVELISLLSQVVGALSALNGPIVPIPGGPPAYLLVTFDLAKFKASLDSIKV